MHGLGIYVRDSLPASRELNLESSDESYICLRLSLLQSTSYLFFVYRSPSSQSCSVVNSISENIDKALLTHPSANIFVFGDFNIHHAGWLPFSHTTSLSGINTYNFAVSHSLTQLIDSPTRIPDRADQEPSLLDLFLSSNPDICKTSTSGPLGNSDHSVVNVAIDFNTFSSRDPPIHRKLFSYHRGDWDNFRDLIRDLPLDYIFHLDTEKCAEEISSWLQVGIDAYIPSRKYQVKPHSTPWFSPAIAAAISHRNHFYHRYQRCSSEDNKSLFTRARNDCKKIIEEAKRSYQNQVHDRLVSESVGSRDFWRIYRSFSNKGKSLIPPLFNGPEVLTSAASKAELLAKQFSCNSTLDDTGHVLPEIQPKTDVNLSSLHITPEMVADVIKFLDSSKATGPDEIPVIVLQKCSPELSPILCRLFRKCIEESCCPSCWKQASVVPVFKNSGERSDPRNYRPISLLSIISKVFESLINSALTRHLESLHLFSDHQYGFRSGRSSADALTVLSERVYRSLNACGETRAIALDISKAFDEVWHRGLLHKLKSYGISGTLLDLIRSFLTGRSIKVVLDGHSSIFYPINSGVPQGSVIGPTLFLIFINDLPDCILSKLAIYADDTTLYSSLDKTKDLFDKVEMAAELEDDLRTVVEWGQKWLVTFNASKTKLLSINRFREPVLPSVLMNGSTLTESSHIRLLGLTLSQNFTWNSYIESIAKSAAMKVGSFFRVRHFLSPESIIYIYKATIRPCLEYCCHLWAGASAHCLHLLDRIQKRLVNLVGPDLCTNLHPLSHRRNVASLSLFYKYFYGQCSSDLHQLTPSLKSFSRNTRLSTNSHHLTVQLPTCHKNFYSSSFFPRTSRLWNSLPRSCFPCEYDLQAFKCNVNRHLSLSL